MLGRVLELVKISIDVKHTLSTQFNLKNSTAFVNLWGIRVFGRGLEGSMVSLSLRRGHLQKMFWNPIF